eukprot:COSAG05_NODE_2189_length_3422_cov_14.087872_4_plen_62_part_00
MSSMLLAADMSTSLTTTNTASMAAWSGAVPSVPLRTMPAWLHEALRWKGGLIVWRSDTSYT